jgi:hypothetical protein
LWAASSGDVAAIFAPSTCGDRLSQSSNRRLGVCGSSDSINQFSALELHSVNDADTHRINSSKRESLEIFKIKIRKKMKLLYTL